MSAELERLADLIDELGPVVEKGGQTDVAAWALRFGVGEEQVEHCLEALQALNFSLDDNETRADELRPPELPEDFEVRGELGRGGMGVVYRVHQKSLDREVALKVLRPGDLVLGGAVRRFEREARSLARLRHPHIVSIHQVGQAEGFVFFTMDLVEGRTLEQLVQDQRVTPTQAVKFLAQVGKAIGYAHGQGVVHRDLKPANILVDGEGDAFVVDFGLAIDAGDSGEHPTLSGQLMGTPAYMSPEQVRGEREKVGEPADIYALGTVLYQCLTRQTPFAGLPLVRLMQAVLEDTPPAPRKLVPSVPRDVEVICLKAMAKRPEDRYPTAQAFVEDLERFAAGDRIYAQPPSRISLATHFLWARRRALLTSLATLLVALVVTVFWIVPRLTTVDMIALGEQLVDAGNDSGALVAYRSGLRDQDPAALALDVRVRFLGLLHEEAGRRLFAGESPSEIRPILDEAVPFLPDVDPEEGLLLHRHRELPESLRFEILRHRLMAGGSLTGVGDMLSELGKRGCRNLNRKPTRDVDVLVFLHCVGASMRLDGVSTQARKRLFQRAVVCFERLPSRLQRFLLRSEYKLRTSVLQTRSEDLESALVGVIGDPARPSTLRTAAAGWLHWMDGDYPERNAYRPRGFGPARPQPKPVSGSDLQHIVRVYDAMKRLGKVEAYKKRLELYAKFLPTDPGDADDRGATKPFGPRLWEWYRERTGVRIASRSQWASWWAKHRSEDPRQWLLGSLGLELRAGEDGAKGVLTAVDRRWRAKPKEARGPSWRRQLHQLMRLSVTDPDVVEPSTWVTSLGAWAKAMAWSPLGTQHVRLACFSFQPGALGASGAEGATILWQKRFDLEVNRPIQVHEDLGALQRTERRSMFGVPGIRRRGETWSGRDVLDSSRRRELQGAIHVTWEGAGVRGLAWIKSNFVHGAESAPASQKQLLPGRIRFFTRGMDVHSERRILLAAYLESPGEGAEAWAFRRWQVATEDTLRLESTTPVLSRFGDPAWGWSENLLWGLEVFPVSGSPVGQIRSVARQLAKRSAQDRMGTDGFNPALALLMAGDTEAISKLSVGLSASRVSALELLCRLASKATEPRIRARAFELLGSLPVQADFAQRALRWSEGESVPEPLRARWVAASQRAVPRMRGSWLLCFLGALLLAGLVGTVASRRTQRRHRVFALVLASVAGIFANSLWLDGLGDSYVPSWVSLALVAVGLWEFLPKARRGFVAWTCVLWWPGYAAADLGQRLWTEQSLSELPFFVGAGLFGLGWLFTKPARRPFESR